MPQVKFSPLSQTARTSRLAASRPYLKETDIMGDEEATVFLPIGLERSDSSEKRQENMKADFQEFENRVKRPVLSWLTAPVFLHLFVFGLYSMGFFLLADWPTRTGKHAPGVLYTPAREAMVYERKAISALINETRNKYDAPPSPEVDEAWAALFQYSNVRVQSTELKKLGRGSIQLSDGSGDYLGALDVYHQLHCLKYIRHYIHQDYYKLMKTNVPSTEHVNHCIEMLRQVIMCKADTALMTYQWLPDFPAPWPNFGIEHECVDWERIDDWSKKRSIDVFDPQFLAHPKFGFPYAGRKTEDDVIPPAEKSA